jgi:hypothetical protein
MLKQTLVNPSGYMLPINRPIRATTKGGKVVAGGVSKRAVYWALMARSYRAPVIVGGLPRPDHSSAESGVVKSVVKKREAHESRPVAMDIITHPRGLDDQPLCLKLALTHSLEER